MPTQEKFRSGSKVCTDVAVKIFDDDTYYTEFIFIRAHADSANNVYVCDRATPQAGLILEPGAEITLPVQRTSSIWVSTDVGGSATVSWIGV